MNGVTLLCKWVFMLLLSMQYKQMECDNAKDFFHIPYPLKKLDLLPIPDFAAGAMENWGCVTFREVDVLIDEKTASIANKKRVSLVVSHEIAHMVSQMETLQK